MKPHEHTKDCSHNSIPRVFWLYSIFTGQFFFRMLMSLPLMPEFCQMYTMGKVFCWYQPKDLFFNAMNSISHGIKNNLLKRIIAGFAIPFYIYNILIFYFVKNTIIDNIENSFGIESILYCFLGSTTLFYILIIFSDPGFLNPNLEKNKFEKFYLSRPELSLAKNLCPFCQIPRIARSQHCTFCEKCVCKWEKHCFITNKCIGAGNQIIYCIFYWNYCCALLVALMGIFHEKKEKKKITFLNVGLFVCIFISFYDCMKESILQSISILYNITTYEINTWRRLTYFWGSKKREFFNPFDKGIIHNFRENFEPFFKKNNIVLHDDENILQPSKIGISDNGLRNWNECRIYGVLDIPESPFREFVENEMKNKKENEKNKVIFKEEKVKMTNDYKDDEEERINPFIE